MSIKLIAVDMDGTF
ncbi:hypothetical protein SEEHN189_08800, partial [Salmonella enterica subsp. enterica serovar Heidelberg str. N189]